mgnify:CR=1 FL=1
MGNLGSYQTLTTMSKKVGGPKKLVTLLVGGGVVLGVTIEKSRKYIDKKKKELLYEFKNKNYSVEKDNIYIILGGYKDTYPNLNELDCLANLCSKYENLDSIVNYSYLIDNDKTYEIFTSLSDTQKIYINPISSCSVSGIVLNYHMKQLNPNNVTHISFVDLMNSPYDNSFISCYLKGLTNNNNNFNYNF